RRDRHADASSTAASRDSGKTPGAPSPSRRPRPCHPPRPSSYPREPRLALFVLAADGVEEHLLETRRDGTAAAFADRSVVVFANRCHLGRGAGEERFIGDVDFVTGDTALEHRDAELPRE